MGNLFFSSCIWGHPHSTYAQRARGGVKPNAYDYAHGGRGFSKLHSCAKKFFVRPQNLKTFLSLGKRSYCIAIYFRVQKIESTHKGGVKPYVWLCTKSERASNFGNFCVYVLCERPLYLQKGYFLVFFAIFFPISLRSNMTVTICWKYLASSLIGFIFTFLVFIQSGKSIYDILRF